MNEYISREAAILLPYLPKEYREYQTSNLDDAFEEGWDQALKYVALIPAADVVERKVGHWIFHPEQKNIYGGKLIECSECRTQYLVMNVVEEIYCRHCGSKNQNGGKDDV